MKDNENPEDKPLGTDDVNRTLERLAVAVEQQNAILMEFLRRWEYQQHEWPERRYDSEPETPSSILNWVRDFEHDLGYRDLHGNRLDLDDREDR